MRDLCYGCKTFVDIVYTNPLEQPFCEKCSILQPLTSDEWAFLMITSPNSPLGPPFKPGDKVEVRQVISSDGRGNTEFEYNGVGEVTNVSMSLEHGGTPVYPTFLVVINEKAHDHAPDEAWYPELCLTKVG